MSPQAIGTASSDVLPFRHSPIELTIYVVILYGSLSPQLFHWYCFMCASRDY